MLVEVSKHKLYTFFGEKRGENVLNYIAAKGITFFCLMIFTWLWIYDNIFLIYLSLFDKNN